LWMLSNERSRFAVSLLVAGGALGPSDDRERFGAVQVSSFFHSSSSQGDIPRSPLISFISAHRKISAIIFPALASTITCRALVSTLGSKVWLRYSLESTEMATTAGPMLVTQENL
jgi:hypothetical protein